MTGPGVPDYWFPFFLSSPYTLVTLVSEETVVFLQTLFIHAPCIVACGWTDLGRSCTAGIAG